MVSPFPLVMTFFSLSFQTIASPVNDNFKSYLGSRTFKGNEETAAGTDAL